MKKQWIGKLLALRRDRGGNALLEFALGSGVLISAFTGTFQFGYTFLQYNNLENAVTRGARYASMIPYDSANATPSAAFQTAVANMVLYGSPTAPPAAVPVLPSLASSNVRLTVTFAGGVPSAMTVAIDGYALDSVFAIVTCTNKPQVTFAYQGIWQPI
ncbi:MAG: pilus assembly protein [Candidatus Solibacter usitatus]|nr:pilus assembly protein [Candidatus Solibacter usitatus]